MDQVAIEIPQVVVTAQWSERSRTWILRIPKCPFCGKLHDHGGGDDAAPDLGHRLAHCAYGHPNRPPHGYELVLAAPATERAR